MIIFNLIRNEDKYTQYAQNRLIEVYNENTTEFFKLYDLKHIYNATGSELNTIGKKLGVIRENISDGDYQTELMIQTLVNYGKIKSREVFYNELS